MKLISDDTWNKLFSWFTIFLSRAKKFEKNFVFHHCLISKERAIKRRYMTIVIARWNWYHTVLHKIILIIFHFVQWTWGPKKGGLLQIIIKIIRNWVNAFNPMYYILMDLTLEIEHEIFLIFLINENPKLNTKAKQSIWAFILWDSASKLVCNHFHATTGCCWFAIACFVCCECLFVHVYLISNYF